MQKELTVGGSQFLCKMPPSSDLALSAPLHPLLGSSAPSRVRGQGAHLLPASTGDVHGRVGELCYKLRLLLGTLSPRAQGTRSLCCVPAPPVPRVTRSLRLQCDIPVGTIQWKEDADWAPGQGWEAQRGRSLLQGQVVRVTGPSAQASEQWLSLGPWMQPEDTGSSGQRRDHSRAASITQEEGHSPCRG